MRGQARANRTGGVFDIIGQLHFTARLQGCLCILDHLCIQRIGYLYTPFAAAIARPAINRGLNQNRVQIKVIECRIAARYLCQQIGSTDYLIQPLKAERGQNFAHLFCDMGKELHHLFRCAFEFCPQIITLGTYPYRTGVGMALTHHDTAHRYQRRSADTKFVRPQHGGHNNIAAGFQTAIGTQYHLVAQAVHGEHLMHF